jgi:hypothetical protein
MDIAAKQGSDIHTAWDQLQAARFVIRLALPLNPLRLFHSNILAKQD